MKFVLFVEGHTEKAVIAAFLKRWLDPRLDQNVGVQPVRFDGWGEMIDDLPTRAPMYLNGPVADKIIAVIALLDLYGPTIYPDNRITSSERIAWAVDELENRVNEEQFRQFFAVHDLEAWLLSAPDIFPPPVRDALPTKVKHPETVNFDEPPAQLIERLYRSKLNRDYKKVTDGRILFDRLDPELVYEKCPNFRQMMEELLNLARSAGL